MAAAFFCPQLIVYVNMTLFFHYLHTITLLFQETLAQAKHRLFIPGISPKIPRLSTRKHPREFHTCDGQSPGLALSSNVELLCLAPKPSPLPGAGPSLLSPLLSWLAGYELIHAPDQ